MYVRDADEAGEAVSYMFTITAVGDVFRHELACVVRQEHVNIAHIAPRASE